MADAALSLPYERPARGSVWSEAFRRHWPIVVILGIGLTLRWFSPGRIALWRDEAQFLAIAGLPDVGAMMRFLYESESHPPLYYLLGHLAGTFGNAAALMGVLSLVTSGACIALAYAVGAQLGSRLLGLLAASGTALSVPLVLFSVQLRPYSLVALLMLVSYHAIWRIWKGDSARWLFAWLAASLLGLYTHHAFMLILAGQVLIVISLLLAGHRPARWQWRPLAAALGGLLVLAAPDLILLLHQSSATSYPAMKPFRIAGPPSLLLAVGLGFPFEVLLPLGAGAAWLVARKPSTGRNAEDLLLVGAAPMFLLLATLASYRSHFLTPHVLLSAVPLGAITVATQVTRSVQEGRRLLGLVWAEVAIVCLTLGVTFSVGYEKTTADLVASGIRAEARATDLILAVPSPVASSLERYFTIPNSRIYFPSNEVSPFRFDRYYERVADHSTFAAVVDSIDRARAAGRRIWLVGDARWIDSALPAPIELPREEFGGLGQADRARLNWFYRHLVAVYGAPAKQVGSIDPVRGAESLAGWLFTTVGVEGNPAGETAG